MHVAQLPDSHEYGGLQTAAPRGLEHRVAGVDTRARVLAPSSRITTDSAATATVDGGRVLGDDEPFDEDLRGRDAERRESRLDGVHVRSGPADVEVGVRRSPTRTAHCAASRKPRFVVEMVMDRQPAV